MDDLQFAINMEHDGEQFYRRQAEINKDSSLGKVCLLLADQEKGHARILAEKAEARSFEPISTDALLNAKNVFEGVGDIKSSEKERLRQLDFYEAALDMEKKSIVFYSEHLSSASSEGEKKLFQFLVGQEKQHYDLLDELSSLLAHAEDWVESAEFGIREEY